MDWDDAPARRAPAGAPVAAAAVAGSGSAAAGPRAGRRRRRDWLQLACTTMLALASAPAAVEAARARRPHPTAAFHAGAGMPWAACVGPRRPLGSRAAAATATATAGGGSSGGSGSGSEGGGKGRMSMSVNQRKPPRGGQGPKARGGGGGGSSSHGHGHHHHGGSGGPGGGIHNYREDPMRASPPAPGPFHHTHHIPPSAPGVSLRPPSPSMTAASTPPSHTMAPTLHHHATAAAAAASSSAPAAASSSSSYTLPSQTVEWQRLARHAQEIKTLHLRHLIQDPVRSEALCAEVDGVFMDYSRQQMTVETRGLLLDLARRTGLEGKVRAMARGEKINHTEDRAVLHMATRAARDESIVVDGVDVVQQVHSVLDKIKAFSEQIRSGELRGATGKRIRNIVAVGIGGSYLGPACIHEVFKTEEEGSRTAQDFQLRFLSNVDPVDVSRAQDNLDPEETLVIVISKTFTTAETMLNARTMRQWLWDTMGTHPDVAAKHMAACASASAAPLVQEFGIPTARLFEFWDWVGGRYSVCASPGALPISLKFGFGVFEKFLAGARAMDRHFLSAPLDRNLPVLMGLLGVWNMSFLGYKCRTIIPYAEALMKFPAHIQQVDMESNGKYVTVDGHEINYEIGEIDFGEPGTNGQHSFFQLLHMGQVVPVDFIGFAESQKALHVQGEELSSHDELMCNFFAQPDALAIGKTAQELLAEGVSPNLVAHRTFKGNRPSLSLLMPRLDAFTTGQLLALYEHRTAVQGFVWHVNSFDQWGVELGKQLARTVREEMKLARGGQSANLHTFVPATARLLQRYWAGGSGSWGSGAAAGGQGQVGEGH